MTRSQYLLILSDLHIGSAFGLFPPDFQIGTGNTINLNVAQDYLWQCYNHMLRQLPRRIDYLILNGDICEGQNLSEEARMLSEVDPVFQVRAAQTVLQPILRRLNGPIYLTQSSRYHGGAGGTLDELLGERIGSVKQIGHHCIPWVQFDVGEIHFDVAHRQSVMIRYRSTALEREVGFWLERQGRRAMKRKSVPRRVVLIRSHTHAGFRMIQTEDIIAIGTPAWKIQDVYAQTSITPNRYLPENLGAVGLYIYDKAVNHQFVHVAPYLYEHPD